jgi:hypothetical protein
MEYSMKVININGVELYVCTESEVKKLGLAPTFSWPTVKLVTVTLINKRTLIQLLGLDESKADYAVPQPWADAHHDWYEHVWYYGRRCTIFGEPVNVITGVKFGLAERILQEALESTKTVSF